MIGRLFGLVSQSLLSCDRAMTGTSSSLARNFSSRVMLDSSVGAVLLIVLHLQELEIVHDDKVETGLLIHAPRHGRYLHRRHAGRRVNQDISVMKGRPARLPDASSSPRPPTPRRARPDEAPTSRCRSATTANALPGAEPAFPD